MKITKEICLDLMQEHYPVFYSIMNRRKRCEEGDCLELILQHYPDFRFVVDDNKERNAGDWVNYLFEHCSEVRPLVMNYKMQQEERVRSVGICGEMNEFSSYIADELQAGKMSPEDAKKLFTLIEELLVRGDDDVQTAICTCFLENLINRTPDSLDPRLFVSYLGPESKEYCIAWDKFTGVKTEGLS